MPTSPTSLTVNNLLLGKSAIVSTRGRRLGPPPGAVPPSRQTSQNDKTELHSKPHSSETISWKEEKCRKSLSRRNSVKWKDIKKDKDLREKERYRKASIDLDEAGDGIIVSEHEANEIVASMRSRSSSETSSYSSHSASSTDTSLCDENERASDSESELPDDDKIRNTNIKETKAMPSPIFKDTKLICSPVLSETLMSHASEHLTEITPSAKPVTNISDYLDSTAGEPLRTYIDGFETKLKDSLSVSSEILASSPVKELSPYSPRSNAESEILQRLSRPQYEENSKSNNSITRPTNLLTAKELSRTELSRTELSPIELSPCGYIVDSKSPYNYDFLSNFKHSSTSKPDIISRPPDIIDSLTMYPNFVTDIDLSEKFLSDIETPPRSPGAESITVSEDERPITLTIDKYFEHSPEFFGARVTNPEIPSRRAAKRNARFPKKPDSLTLQSSYNEKLLKDEVERASSLPQSHSFTNITSPEKKDTFDSDIKTPAKYVESEQKDSATNIDKIQTPRKTRENVDAMSPKDYILRSGRKNSERALQIIQENSKILSRILTKQNVSETSISNKIHAITDTELESDNVNDSLFINKLSGTPEKLRESKIPESPLLKESTSDSLIGYRKENSTEEIIVKSDFVRVRPISIDDPFCLEARNNATKEENFKIKNNKSPSIECLGNKTDLYGWENKGFLAKCEYKSTLDKLDSNYDFDYMKKTYDLSGQSEVTTNELKPLTSSDWTQRSISEESKSSVTLPLPEVRDTTATYDRKCTSDDYNYSLSSKYNDYVISKASDICSKTFDQGPKICENLSKTENSQVSDFAHVVTSSISFTYEPSAEDDSPIGAKSNSSDTLCQIASLDQVSTPISPKIFPKETPTHPKEFTEKSERTKLESDDTCSAITSLIETDTLSSLSYPRSPSTGSYHPFPTRPSMRMPKDLGVRLGMYPKDVISSPPK